jgi:topoisomerase IA-like protein
MNGNRFRIVVTEGNAVWETTEQSMGLDPRSGQKITIRRGPLGSFFLRVEGQRSVKGRRVG